MRNSDARQMQDNPASRATRKALEHVDAFLQGATLDVPALEYLDACRELLQSGSPRDFAGILFFMFYWLEEPTWDLNSIPIGWRNRNYGYRFLCQGLTRRHITLHGRTKGYGGDVGSKGDQPTSRPMTGVRYGPFLKAVRNASIKQRLRIADYVAQTFAESKYLPSVLPPVGDDFLTFVRAKDLFQRLISIPSGGAVRQFVIAALLFVYRQRSWIRIVTHQVHAADASARVAGDIEEYADGKLCRAYAVTLSPEWKATISGFRDKMDKFHLSRYVIVVGGVNKDDDWAVPAKLALKLEPYERDIAVIDILDVVNFLATELTPGELREAVNKCNELLNDLSLCGRPEYIATYREVVHGWLSASSAAH